MLRRHARSRDIGRLSGPEGSTGWFGVSSWGLRARWRALTLEGTRNPRISCCHVREVQTCNGFCSPSSCSPLVQQQLFHRHGSGRCVRSTVSRTSRANDRPMRCAKRKTVRPIKSPRLHRGLPFLMQADLLTARLREPCRPVLQAERRALRPYWKVAMRGVTPTPTRRKRSPTDLQCVVDSVRERSVRAYALLP